MSTRSLAIVATAVLLAVLLVVLLVGLLMGPSSSLAAEDDWRDQYPRLRYGVQSVETQAATLTRYVKFADYVKQRLGVELEIFMASEYAGIIQAIAAGQIDMMDMGASGYAAAWLESKGGIEPLVVPRELDGSVGYHSVMFVRADSDFHSVEDLRGRTFAWADPNSASGYLFPLISLRQQGLEPERHFGRVMFSGGHEQSIIGVLDGAYDAAVTWTNDVEQHSRGGLHMMLARGMMSVEDIRIVWVSDLIPNPVVAIRSDAPEAMKNDIRDMFMNLHLDDPEVFREVARGDSSGYIEAHQELYQIAIDLRQKLVDERRRR